MVDSVARDEVALSRRLTRPCVVWIAVVSHMCASGSLFAKCPLATYELSVTVVEQGSEKPVPGAPLLFFVPGGQNDLALFDGDQQVTRTDSDGTVRGTLKFNTYSGTGLRGDRCKAALKQLEIIVVLPDGSAQRFWFDKLRTHPRRHERGFEVAPLKIELCT